MSNTVWNPVAGQVQITNTGQVQLFTTTGTGAGHWVVFGNYPTTPAKESASRCESFRIEPNKK